MNSSYSLNVLIIFSKCTPNNLRTYSQYYLNVLSVSQQVLCSLSTIVLLHITETDRLHLQELPRGLRDVQLHDGQIPPHHQELSTVRDPGGGILILLQEHTHSCGIVFVLYLKAKYGILDRVPHLFHILCRLYIYAHIF